MNDLEDLVLKEANRQGYQPGQDAIRQAAIDLAGASLVEGGLIALPGLGSITPADFVRSLRKQMPDAFKTAGEQAKGNLTQRMQAELAARRRSLPADWDSVYKRMTGLTREMMAEVARNRQGN